MNSESHSTQSKQTRYLWTLIKWTLLISTTICFYLEAWVIRNNVIGYGYTISKRIVPTWYLYTFMNKYRLWLGGLILNVIPMSLPIWFCPVPASASTWQSVQNLLTALPARGCHVLQRVIGWELSCTCIVMSWPQRRRPKHGGLSDRWGSTCHAHRRKFAIKIQC